MIPLRDTIASNTFPFVTYLLIAINVAISFYQVHLGSDVERFMSTYALVPSHFAHDGARTLVTSMFLHGNWWHLIGNMLYLHIFGDNVEDRLGHGRFLTMYFAAGILAGVVQLISNPHSSLPIVGASGAIAGVTGAYFWFFPRARVVTLVPIFIFVQVIEVPAIIFLLFWFGVQLMLGVESLGLESAGGVAVWAHIGGFVAGMVLGPLLARRVRRTVEPAW